MRDKIEPRELGMFLGTDLYVVYRNKKKVKLTGISGGMAVLGEGENWFYADIESIRPIVKNMIIRTPMSVMDVVSNDMVNEFSMSKSSYNEVKCYAMRLNDVFNWLQKTGPDGKPLAVEMDE